MPLGQTPSQTVGPYFAYGLTAEQYGYPFTSLFPPRIAQPRPDLFAVQHTPPTDGVSYAAAPTERNRPARSAWSPRIERL